jgi:hypothetical protein
MKKFLIESAVFLILIFISFFLVFLKADGYTDPFYLRFTSPKQHSLILGNSRAAQGIQPTVLNEVITGSDFYNYSFTLTTSPYGPAYLASIQKKLDPDTKNGIFILSVDPWSISSNKKDPNDSTQFPETIHFMGKTRYVNLYPNIPYLLDSYRQPFIKILFPHETSMYIHQDGWLEVTTKMDSVSLKKNLSQKVDDYKKNNLPVFHFSEVRFNYLIKTIEFLKSHGKVYLVRLPVHPLVVEIDNELMPDFNEKIRFISEKANTPYLDITSLNTQILFTDGNHIYKESGVEISRIIGNWILSFN